MSTDSSNINVVEPAIVESTLSERRARLADFGLFFKKFIAKGRTISSAVPSSPAMVSSILQHVDFSRPATIVELGAGTGRVTEQVRLWKWLQQSLSPNGVFIQITVVPLIYRSFYTRLFDSVNYRMVWLNVPPGGVYRCAKPRRRLMRSV